MVAGAHGTQVPGSHGPDQASPARVHNRWQGGTAHYEADRAVAAAIEEILPQVRQMAADSALFNARTAGYAATAGVGQFIVLGCGLPPRPRLHEVARSVRPGAVAVYVDRDLSVTDELGDLLAGEDGIAVVNGDPCDPGRILADKQVAGVIDLGRPVCLLASGVAHYAAPGRARAAVAGYVRRVAAGSFVAACVPQVPDTLLWRRLGRLYTPVRVYRYTPVMLAGLLGGLELVPPGITTAGGLQPGWGSAPGIPAGEACVLAAVGCKAGHRAGCWCPCGGQGWCGLCRAAGCPPRPGRGQDGDGAGEALAAGDG